MRTSFYGGVGAIAVALLFAAALVPPIGPDGAQSAPSTPAVVAVAEPASPLPVDNQPLLPASPAQDQPAQPAARLAPAAPPAAPAVAPAPAPVVATAPKAAGSSKPLSFEQAFIERAGAAARETMQRTGVPASVTIAQAILESYWGESKLSRDANNYFGIKATYQPGPAGVVWMLTYEAGIGTIRAPFRAYHNMVESFVDHGRFFIENSRYAAAMAVKADARAFAQAIHREGYATDPDYSAKLLRYMDRFNLESYDH